VIDTYFVCKHRIKTESSNYVIGMTTARIIS